jgi:predicted ATPase
MLTRIEALNFRALRYVDQRLEPFQVLIGPNASGKSTFLDVIAFLADIVTSPALADAVRVRAPHIRDLTWMGHSDWLELAVETRIPEQVMATTGHTHLRYEVRVGIHDVTGELALLTETLWLMRPNGAAPRQTALFPATPRPPDRITHVGRTKQGWRTIVNKTGTGNDYFKSEKTDWNNMFRLGPKRSALANLPEDEERFPASTWFKRYIAEGVQRLMLNSEALRRPSPPQSPRTFLPDGSNLPWAIDGLEKQDMSLRNDWIAHLRTALPDVEQITTVERPEDRHRYLVVQYASGLRVPSWMVSDGTLRMLALTILAYLPDIEGIYLIEEPENGLHPRAVETVLQSLSSVYSAQVLLATHSPVILSQTAPKDMLCFTRNPDGETAIVRGNEHPRLTSWRGEVSLDVLFAGGVLG